MANQFPVGDFFFTSSVAYEIIALSLLVPIESVSSPIDMFKAALHYYAIYTNTIGKPTN